LVGDSGDQLFLLFMKSIEIELIPPEVTSQAPENKFRPESAHRQIIATIEMERLLLCRNEDPLISYYLEVRMDVVHAERLLSYQLI
jgi:hypothetical protein